MRVGILIDVLKYQNEKTGMGRYTVSLLTHLSSRKDIEVYPITSDGQIEGDFIWKKDAVVLNRMGNVSLFYRLHRYSAELRRLKLDIIHCPGGFPPRYFPICNSLKVVTIHGVLPLISGQNILPTLSYRKRLVFKVFQGVVDRFIAVSYAERDDLHECCKIPMDKIEVIYHGVDHDKFRHFGEEEISAVRERYGLRFPYVLDVCNYSPHKNLIRLVEAFTRVRSEGVRDLQLVIAGGGPGYKEFRDWIGMHPMRDKIVMLGEVSDKWLPGLYAGAELFILPSLSESFGLPVLEAMACGTPVVASNAFSLPEIAGDAALLINPTSVDDIASAICTVHSDKGLRNELRRKGFKRAQQYSWEECARRHAELYQGLCDSR